MSASDFTIGSYLATRLGRNWRKHYFAIPGDEDSDCLTSLSKTKILHGSVVVMNSTWPMLQTVMHALMEFRHSLLPILWGGLSSINAVAGAYAQDLPVIVISAAPGPMRRKNQILHHALGIVNYRYVREMYERVTALATTIRHPEDAAYQIDFESKWCLLQANLCILRLPVILQRHPSQNLRLVLLVLTMQAMYNH